MKNWNYTVALLLLVTGLSVGSCSSDDSSSPINENPVNTGELRLFLVDTARIKTIKPDGSNETTILDKHVNSSSYIGRFSIAPNGEKFVYTETQWSPTASSDEIRIANSDGTGDQVLYVVPDPQTDIQMLQFISNDRICFVTVNYSNNTRNINFIKPDGTGASSATLGYESSDITSDEKYLVTYPGTGMSGPVLRIIDRAGDNGAGGLYHAENFDSTVTNMSDPMFTRNDSKVVVAYVQDNTVRLRIVDMQTKTSETVDLLTNQTSTTLSLSLSIGADNNRGVLTIADYNTNAPSVTHVFNISTSTVTSTFNNNDDNVFDVYAW